MKLLMKQLCQKYFRYKQTETIHQPAEAHADDNTCHSSDSKIVDTEENISTVMEKNIFSSYQKIFESLR